MPSEAKKRANAKYDSTHTQGLYLKLNLVSDADIIDWLERMARLDGTRGKQGYIKALIRADMERQ